MPRRFVGVDRRTLLRGAGTMALTSALPTAWAEEERRFFDRNNLPIGLQLYTIGDAATKDLDGTFAKLSRIGYHTIELAGFHGHEPAALRAAANRAKLELTSIHIGAGSDKLALNHDFSALVVAVHEVGASTIVMPGPLLRIDAGEVIPPTLDDWKRTADFLNKKGAALRRQGLSLGYHNHNIEFAPISNTTGLDVLLGGTEPDLVKFEMDAGWVCAAGLDPIDLLGRYPGRFRLMHLKDIKGTTRMNFVGSMDSTEVGHGVINWERIIPAAYSAGVRQYFVEQEPPFEKNRFQSVAESFHYLASMPTT